MWCEEYNSSAAVVSVFLFSITNSMSVTRGCCSKSRTLQSQIGVINSAVLSQIHGAVLSQLTTDPLHQSTRHDWKHSRWLVTDWRPINTDTDESGLVWTGVDEMLYPFVWCLCALQLMLALECVCVCECLYACFCTCVFMRSDFYAVE